MSRCLWITVYTCNGKVQNINYYQFILTLVNFQLSFAIFPSSYETKLFCFVSVQKGMLINYMLPVSILIIATTVLALNGIRKINLELSKLELTSSESLNALRPEDIESNDKKVELAPDEEVLHLREYKRCLKLLSLVQTSYDVVWFISVLALENGSFSNVMPVMFAIASCSLVSTLQINIKCVMYYCKILFFRIGTYFGN